MKFTLKFSCYNGDLADSIVVERKDGTNGNWKGVKTFPLSESNTNLSYGDVVENAGTYTYRIAEHMFNGTVKYSEEVYNVIEGADGTADLQYGTLSASSTDNIYAFMKENYTENPAIITGGTTYKNTSFAPVENIVSISRSGYFTFKYFPWTLSTSTTFTKAETTSYLIAQTGRGTIGTLNYEAGPIVNASNRPQRINRLMLQEYITLGQRVSEFNVEYYDSGEWHTLDTGEPTTTIGYKRLLRFNTITTNRLRINFTSARGPLCLSEIGAFCAT